MMSSSNRLGFCLAVVPFVAACVGQVEPMPLAASGPTEVVVQGASFLADLQPTQTGAQILVSREALALRMDEGLLAKTVATQFCAARGQTLDPRALAAFSAGLWVFDGGCQ